jgi:hypothetical protein
VYLSVDVVHTIKIFKQWQTCLLNAERFCSFTAFWVWISLICFINCCSEQQQQGHDSFTFWLIKMLTLFTVHVIPNLEFTTYSKLSFFSNTFKGHTNARKLAIIRGGGKPYQALLIPTILMHRSTPLWALKVWNAVHVLFAPVFIFWFLLIAIYLYTFLIMQL